MSAIPPNLKNPEERRWTLLRITRKQGFRCQEPSKGAFARPWRAIESDAERTTFLYPDFHSLGIAREQIRSEYVQSGTVTHNGDGLSPSVSIQSTQDILRPDFGR